MIACLVDVFDKAKFVTFSSISSNAACIFAFRLGFLLFYVITQYRVFSSNKVQTSRI